MKRLIEPEFPSSDKLQLYGALAFLYFHSARHRRWPVESLRLILQPPVDLDQAKIFYHEGAPRGAITWGLLDEAAEQSLLRGEMLKPAQWHSGRNFWLMEVLAPYEQGTGTKMMRWVKDNLPDTVNTVRFRRIGPDHKPKRVIESHRLQGKTWGARILHTYQTED